MKNKNFLASFLLFMSLSFLLSGCDVITGIFEAGIWTGIILVVLIVALVLWLFNRGRGRR